MSSKHSRLWLQNSLPFQSPDKSFALPNWQTAITKHLTARCHHLEFSPSGTGLAIQTRISHRIARSSLFGAGAAAENDLTNRKTGASTLTYHPEVPQFRFKFMSSVNKIHYFIDTLRLFRRWEGAVISTQRRAGVIIKRKENLHLCKARDCLFQFIDTEGERRVCDLLPVSNAGRYVALSC